MIQLIEKATRIFNTIIHASLTLAAIVLTFAVGYGWYILCSTFLLTMGLLLTSLVFFAPFIIGGIDIYFQTRKKEIK